jgi:hypothetical protein
MRSAYRSSTRSSRDIDPRRRTAYHEAGHAVLSAAINDKPHHVSIRAAHGTLGRSGQQMLAQPTSITQVYLAGFAAEHILTRRRPRQYDIETGLTILAHTDPDLTSTFEGVDASDGYGAVRHLLRTGARLVENELRQEVDRFYEIARESLSVIWPPVKALAEALLVHEELDRERLDEVIGDTDIYTPAFAVQQAHGLMPARVQVERGRWTRSCRTMRHDGEVDRGVRDHIHVVGQRVERDVKDDLDHLRVVVPGSLDRLHLCIRDVAARPDDLGP